MRNDTIIRKAWLLLTALLLTVFAKAQEPCEITCNVEMPVCSESEVMLSVPNNYLYSFLWSPGGQTTHRITVRPFETTTYSVEIRETESNNLVCQSEITVEVKPRFEVDFRQLKLTCSNSYEENGRTAQVMASVDSTSQVYAPPFEFVWYESRGHMESDDALSPLHISPGNPSWAIGLEA